MSSSSTSSSSSSSTLYNNNNKIKTSSLDEIFYDLSVNFLLYVVLIIVFYLVVRFYLEEDTSSPRSNGYVPVVTEDLDQKIDENTTDSTDVNKAPTTPLPVEIDDSSPKRTKRSNSFLNINEWGEPEGTKQEVIQRVFFCA
jgi:hypothetical protein